MAIGDWMKSQDWLANIGHVLAGAVMVLVTTLFTRAPGPIAIAMSAFLAAVLFKEYFIDLRYESDETVGSSTVDAAGYVLGAALASGLVLLAHALGRW